MDALASADDIEVNGSLTGMPMISLRPGVSLRGGSLRFGAKGIRLSSDNRIEDVTVIVPDWELAIFNDTAVSSLGRIRLTNVRSTGQVLLLADSAVRSGHVDVDGLVVASADVRGRSERQHGFGVDALQGAFTLWNRQPDAAVRITATLTGISAGSAESPIRGSGVFLAGHGSWSGQGDGGTMHADLLSTGQIVTDGGIEPGTPDLISAGVYVVSGAEVETVINDGPVTTLGANDMVLDNWGKVGSWTARAPLTSHGPSGIGFVNFGELERLDVQAPVTTHGPGARGFNLYDGTLTSARFQSITTYAGGAVGIQVSKELPRLDITDSVTTFGSHGTSLVRGQQTQLSAIAVSVLAAGRIGQLTAGGSLSTHGDQVVTLEVAGTIEALKVQQGITAAGVASDAVRLAGEIQGLDEVTVTAAHGQAIVPITPGQFLPAPLVALRPGDNLAAAGAAARSRSAARAAVGEGEDRAEGGAAGPVRLGGDRGDAVADAVQPPRQATLGHSREHPRPLRHRPDPGDWATGPCIPSRERHLYVPHHRNRRYRLRRIGHRHGGRRSRSSGHRAQPRASRRARPRRELRPGRRHGRGGAVIGHLRCGRRGGRALAAWSARRLFSRRVPHDRASRRRRGGPAVRRRRLLVAASGSRGPALRGGPQPRSRRVPR
jgi:hypothetical protein